MMTNQYRIHRRRFLPYWAIIGMLCIVAGCADSTDTVKVEHTKLEIDNLRVDSVDGDVITVAFTINEPATIFWTLYAHNAPLPDDINTVISDARASSSDPMIVRNGVQEEGDADAGTHMIRLTNLPSARSYNLYVAAVGTDGEEDLADAMPITTVRNISDIDITRIHNWGIQINWINPSAQAIHVLDEVIIDWNATNNYIDDASGASGSYSATHTLAANAKAHVILPILSTRFFDYELSLTALYRDGSRLPPVTANYRYIIDDDGDSLIDIYTLEALSNIRCNPNGTAYQEVSPDGTCFDFGIACGIDGASDCGGYELRRDLNFNERRSYTKGIINPNWQPNTANDSSGLLTTANRGKNRGWIPIENIATTFEGNGHTIENLYVRNTTTQNYQLSGLFARINGSGARIKNVILKSAFVYGGSGIGSHVGVLAGELSGGTIENIAVIGGKVDGESGNEDRAGGLIGQSANKGIIRNSYATATVHGGEGRQDYVGGLVGHSDGSTITASHATGDADGGAGTGDYAGGLIGRSNDSTITASYATGDTNGGTGTSDYVGGLVGINTNSNIIASYATGDANASGGGGESIGGLVGYSDDSVIIASYATGNANGSNRNIDLVGGLVGESDDSAIIASYATGNADGSTGISDYAGGLVGRSDGSTITASYAVGNAENGADNTTDALGYVSELSDSIYSDYVAGSFVKNSYGFGTTRSSYGNAGENSSSPLPPGASRASHLTVPVASNPPNTAVPQVWDSTAEHSKDAWDFGTSSQQPALRYADYDGDGGKYSCDQFPAPCGTLIPGQRE